MMNVEDDSAPWGDNWRLGRNFRKITELHTRRNLWALAALLEAIDALQFESDISDWLRGCLTGIILGVSRMNQYRPEVSFPLNIMVGTYYLPQISKEEYIPKHFENKVKRVGKGIDEIAGMFSSSELSISTDDISRAVGSLPSCSVDYIFTDPPYAGKIQYGELNFIWEAWLKLDIHWHNDEIIINSFRDKAEHEWATAMRDGMSECFRVLKPGRWLSLCYHDTSEGTWALVQDIMAECGFVIDSSERALFIDTGGKTYNQTQADKVNKRDLVINFRKPKPGEITAAVDITGDEDKATFSEKVRQIIREYLGAHPGASKDRIYDEVVSSMVRSGRMEAYDFDELLSQVAEEVKTPVMKNLFEPMEPDLFGTHEVGRWYLKETELAVADEAETAKEDAAAEKIAMFMKDYLEKHPGEQGVHYSDLFEHYVYSVKDKPRRQLAEFLPDYFYKTDLGTWRLPASDEEERAKAEVRAKGVGRRVKRYIAQLEQGVAIPENERPNDATLAEWIRHCKRSGLYEQGKLLYEKGGLDLDNLSEEAMVNVEEDYQVCARMLARQTETKPKRRGRKKRE